jgi:hypothetical protein
MTQSKILNFFMSVIFISFSTLLFAQKKTLVLKGGVDVFNGSDQLFTPFWCFGMLGWLSFQQEMYMMNLKQGK